MATVLVVGATGNIGVAAILAALKSKLSVLAIVRNQTSADKLFHHVGTKEGITTVEADVTSESGVQGVVDKVKAGKLPTFQHVYSTCGAWDDTPLSQVSHADFRKVMNINFDANFYAYRATIPYLLEQKDTDCTFTQCTGGAPDFGFGGVCGASQAGLFGILKIASKENEQTNVRVNESYLCTRVEYDESAEKKGVVKASEYAKIYEVILAKKEIKGSRVSVFDKGDLEDLKIEKLLKMTWKGQSGSADDSNAAQQDV